MERVSTPPSNQQDTAPTASIFSPVLPKSRQQRSAPAQQNDVSGSAQPRGIGGGLPSESSHRSAVPTSDASAVPARIFPSPPSTALEPGQPPRRYSGGDSSGSPPPNGIVPPAAYVTVGNQPQHQAVQAPASFAAPDDVEQSSAVRHTTPSPSSLASPWQLDPPAAHHAHQSRYQDVNSPLPAQQSNASQSGAAQPQVHALRASMCAALGGAQHAGRLSYHGSALAAAEKKAAAALSPPPPLQSSPLRVQLPVDTDVFPEDAISQQGSTPQRDTHQYSGNSPVAVEPFLASDAPRGRYVLFNMLSTWGDCSEVGMCEVQLFDSQGQRIVPPLQSAATTASNPPFTIVVDTMRGGSSAAHTPSRGASPMTGQCQDAEPTSDADAAGLLSQRHNPWNLVNSVHAKTCTDEAAMYVTPFSDGQHHLVCLVFPKNIELSAIRIYNYRGGGRTKTSKGVRLMEVTVDDVLVFRGDIEEARATDDNDDDDPNCETILFTEDRRVLERLLASSGNDEIPSCPPGTVLEHHHNRSSTTESRSLRSSDQTASPAPLTSAVRTSVAFAPSSYGTLQSPDGSSASSAVQQQGLTRSESTSVCTAAGVIAPCLFPSECPRGVTSICLQVQTTWGDRHVFGMSGIRIRDPQGKLLPTVIHDVFLNRPSGKSMPLDSDGSDAATDEMLSLFDEDPATACTWPFETGVQLILALQQPVDLGFIEVANYSQAKKTYCGAKCVQLFVSSLPVVGTRSSTVATRQALCLHYARLWDRDAGTNAAVPRDVVELTPPYEGVTLRKSPALMPSLRFQSFDLSLATSGAGGAAYSSSHSLRLSMNTRAAVAMRRARMALREPPEWLMATQGYLPSIFPVAYVYRFTAVISANATTPLKQLLAAWAAKPLEAIEFLSEDSTTQVDPGQLWCEGLVSAGDETVEDAFESDSTSAASLTVTLAFVSDAPFAISAVFLRAPRCIITAPPKTSVGQRDGQQNDVSCAWVRRLTIAADDEVVFESVAVSSPLAYLRRSQLSAVHKVADDAIPTVVPPVIFFTLDDRVLKLYADDARR